MLKEILCKYKNEIREILNALKNCYFDELDEYEFENDFIDAFKEKYHKQFSIGSGASKGVLIFKDFSFVIKIPFYFCEGDELQGAYEASESWNYCDQEMIRYEVAKDEGFQDVFLEVEYLDEVNGHPIYIQPYAEILCHIDYKQYEKQHCSSFDAKDREIVNMADREEGYDELDSGWEADLYVLYGLDFYKKFKKYLIQNYICDLGNANIGYIGKKPVLVDYAGFDS